MKPLKKEDISQEVFDLYDDYAHNKLNRREFVEKLSLYAIGGITKQNIPGAIFSFGLPDNYIKKINEESASSGIDSLCEAGMRVDCIEIPIPAPAASVSVEPEKQELEEKKAESRISKSDSENNYWFSEQFYYLLLGSVIIMIIAIFIRKIVK